jgi:hypothetical protein
MNFIIELDFLGPPPNLCILSKNRLKTKLGGILSILDVILISILSIYFIFGMLSRQHFNLITSSLSTNDTRYNLSHFPLVYTPIDVNMNPFVDSSLVNFAFGSFEINSQTNHNKITLKPATWCNIKQYPEETRKYFEDIPNLNSSFCMNVTDVDFKGRDIYGGGDSYVVPNGNFFLLGNKCVNSTTNPETNKCRPKEELEKRVANFYVKVSYLDFHIDHTQKSPGQAFLATQMLWVSSTIYKVYSNKIKKVEYISDFGWIFEEKTIETFFQYSVPSESVDDKPNGIMPGNMFAYSFTTGADKVIFYRNYQKAQDVLANVGGIMKGIMFLSYMFNLFIAKNEFLDRLADVIFEKEKDNKKNSHSSNNVVVYDKNILSVTPTNNKLIKNM